MTVIDVHAHLMSFDALAEMRDYDAELAPQVLERDGGYFLEYPGRAPLGPIPATMFDVDRRIEEMDERRVDVQVVAVPPPQFNYHLAGDAARAFARIQNDAALEVSSRHPQRIHVLATLPLQDPAAAVEELDRVARRPLVRGVEIGTNVDTANLDDPGLEPVWAALADLDMPAWVHPDQRAIAGASRLGSYYLQNLIGNPLESTIAMAALIFGGVLERHPRLRVGFVHGGGFVPYQIGRWDHGWGCRPEPRQVIARPPSHYFRRLYFDSLTHGGAALEFLGRQVGWSQVMVGSDYPFDMASDDPVGAVEQIGLSDTERAAVFSSNAGRFLRPLPA